MSKPATPSLKKRRPSKKKKGSPFIRFCVKLGFFCFGLGASGVLLGGMALALAWPNLPDLHAMTDYRPRLPLRVYTADKVLMGEFGDERRNVLRFHEIPAVMKAAVLAAEDDRFYEHGGIDWMGVLRASLANLVNLSKIQGASTITMQVARNFYLSSEKTYTRKFYEILLTFKIEASLSKDQIFELYMNQIYLGHRTYGFAAASRLYFGKSLAQITPAEAAMLAGIPKAPSRFNPISNLPRAELRQHYVLNRMHHLGYLNRTQYQHAVTQPIVLKPINGTLAGDYAIHGEYAAELARQLLYGIYQDQVYSRGLNVYTTVHSKDQESAYRAVRAGVLAYTRRAPYPGPEAQLHLPAGIENDPQALDDFLDNVLEKYTDSDDLRVAVILSASPDSITLARSSREIITIHDKKTLSIVARALSNSMKATHRLKRGSVVYFHKINDKNWEVINLPAVQAAFVALSPQNGALRAMVGGFDFYRGNFNRVTQAWRQPGSNIKPFIYAAALERGLTPATQICDQPFFLSAEQTGSKAWNPKNYGNKYEPMLTLRQGLYKSRNMVSIRILQAIGPEYAQDYLARFGFDKARQPAVLPLALGAGSVTPLQLTGAYAVFANGGYRVTPYLIDHVTDSSGKVIMQAKPVPTATTPRAIDPRTAFVMNDLLQGVTMHGTASRTRQVLKRQDIAGKTGTTNDSMDAWFSGYTPDLVATAWLGYDQPRSLGVHETGGGIAMPIWLSYMQDVLKDVPEHPPRNLPENLMVEGGEFYFSEYPPGQAVAQLGLTPSPAESLLNTVRADSPSNPSNIQQRASSVSYH